MSFDLEIPGFYSDALVLDSNVTQRPIVINRDPEPTDLEAPAGTHVRLDIVDTGPSGVATAFTKVYVAGVLAYDGGAGGFQAGFNGPASSATNPAADTLRLVIDRTTDFASEQVVLVRVVSRYTGAVADTLDQTYSFTVEDDSAPVLLSVAGTDLRRVRVTYDDPMKQLDPAVSSDALNPANYTIARLTTVPSAEVGVLRVEATGLPHAVDLILDRDMTPGALYQLTVANVQNVTNFVIGSPNTLTFTGFVPFVPTGRAFELIKLLPSKNRGEDVTQDLARFVSVLQEVVNLELVTIDRFMQIADLDLAPEEFLDLILLGQGNPFPFDITTENKRRLARLLVAIYQAKGTEQGLIGTIRFFFGVECTIVPYPAGNMQLGIDQVDSSFVLDPSLSFQARAFSVVSPRVLTAQERTGIRFIIKLMKPANTHCVGGTFGIVEPTAGVDHMELGLSRLGDAPAGSQPPWNGTAGTNGTWILH